MSDYKPITGELRKYATVSWDPWPDARDRLYQMCDEIDSVHAQLERENAELKAELDRVTGEQEEHAHARGDSITGELREWASVEVPYKYGHQLTAIADRIDAEHERAVMSAMNDALYHANDESMAEYGWYRALDADKQPIKFGDEVKHNGVVAKVLGITFHGTTPPTVCIVRGDCWVEADELRHHHAPTVEDVLREFALAVCKDDALTIRKGVVEAYAAKLRLVNDEE